MTKSARWGWVVALVAFTGVVLVLLWSPSIPRLLTTVPTATSTAGFCGDGTFGVRQDVAAFRQLNT